ncbi:MAG: hypothetical protein GXY83_24000 [Rhodopirellula sp.]|nr:hypothetical protein [Rhodopirellula sp.]
MSVLATMTSVVSALKLASDGVKALKEFTQSPDATAKVAELSAAVFSAYSAAIEVQSQHATLLRQISDLEQEIMQLKAWDAEKARYQLAKPWNSPALVYALKKSEARSEPPHLLCTHCYQKNIKSILQPGKAPRESRQRTILLCPACTTEIAIQFHISAPQYAEHYPTA